LKKTRSPWAVLAVLCLGLFMLLLDGTIVNVAIPHIMTSLDTDLSGVEWVMNAYVLVFAVTLVTFGRLGDLYGRRLMFMGGMGLFGLASLACGLATSIDMLIVFRVVQGLGGAAMMPATLSIIAAVFPAERRGAAMGIWGAVSGFATAIGPSLGGLIVDSASWRWIFLINPPIAVISIFLAWRVVPESKDPGAVKSLDLPGVGLISVSVFCLTFALIEGQHYGWTSPLILGLFGACVVLFGLFYWREHACRQPLIDFSLFRDRTFSAGNLTGLILSFGMMGVFFTIPIFLQTVLGFSAIKAGALMSPLSVAIMISAPLAGRLSDRVGGRWIISAGLLVMAFGIAWMAGLTPFQHGLEPTTSAASLIAPFVICGLGIGLAIAPTTSAVMAAVPMERVGNASGVLSTLRQLGSVMGIAVLGAVLQNRVVANVVAGVQSASGIPAPVKQAIVKQVEAGGGSMGAGSTGGSGGGMPAAFQTMFQGWFTDAVNTTFTVAVVVCLAGAVSALFMSGRVRSARTAGEALPSMES
jgi:EmrB/QacA subfamily drug resistance transporter